VSLQQQRIPVVLDIETDGLDPSVIWVIVTQELGGEPRVWTAPYDDFLTYAPSVDTWVMHNGLSFDGPVINKLLAPGTIDYDKVVDTFVVSRLVNYPRFNSHSLDEIGTSLGMPKIKFDDWSKLSDEMIHYCKRDVKVNEAVYNLYKSSIESEQWAEALRCEYRMHMVCKDMHDNGFKFNTRLADNVLFDIKRRLNLLEETFMKAWPPQLEPVNELKYRVTVDGVLYTTVAKAMDKYPKTQVKGSSLICYDFVEFSPSSPKQRIDKLWEAGWQPTEKTKGHYKHDLKKHEIIKATSKEAWQERKEQYDIYGWTCNEENLATLPESAPEAASALAQWLTLNGRLKALEERLRECEEDGRIRTNFWHIGAWTHRMSHSSPNLANISSPFHGEAKTAVEKVKEMYDAKLRQMFMVDKGSYLVGTDAESIQLRVLAHYLRNDDYVHAIVSGIKANGTDIHNVNRRALDLEHLIRDDAKTFIYAWLLGAGNAKVGRILRVPVGRAKEAVDSFVTNTQGLGELKRGRIRRDASRGYFEGLDGRYVINDSEYLMLAGYLQNGESVIMKHANLLWREWADAEKMEYLQVNFVHDEWQTQSIGSLDQAERLGELQRNSLVEVGKRLGTYCPMAGATNIGQTWLDTH
jgi:DNA polymerase-1